MSSRSSASPTRSNQRALSRTTSADKQQPAPTSQVSASYDNVPELTSSYSMPPPGEKRYVSPYPPVFTTHPAPSALPITVTHNTRTSTPQPLSATPTTEALENQEPTQKAILIKALNERRVNTIGELRRVERIFASLGSSDVTHPMTSAWLHYVNSHSLLNELRGLTQDYPFSSDCLDEAKRRVHQDPASNRSWNYCWLVLAKIHTDRLIPIYARTQALRPEMWGGVTPLAESVGQLTKAFVTEWEAALAQLLRFWESAPVR